MPDIHELLVKLIKQNIPVTLVKAKVLEVSENTCHVQELVTETEHFDCAINAIQNNSNDFLKLFPKKNSNVVIGVFDNKSKKDAFIISTSEVERVEFKIGSTNMELSQEGYKIERSGENLLNILDDFMTEVNKIVVVQGTTINQLAVEAIKQRLNSVLI